MPIFITQVLYFLKVIFQEFQNWSLRLPQFPRGPSFIPFVLSVPLFLDQYLWVNLFALEVSFLSRNSFPGGSSVPHVSKFLVDPPPTQKSLQHALKCQSLGVNQLRLMLSSL